MVTRRSGEACATSAVALSLELGALAELSAWPPLRARTDALVAALRGGDGVSAAEVDVLRAWRTRWVRCSPRVRAFYRDALDAGVNPVAVSRGLRAVLCGTEPPPWVRGALRRAYRDLYGRVCAIDPVPRVSNGLS